MLLAGHVSMVTYCVTKTKQHVHQCFGSFFDTIDDCNITEVKKSCLITQQNLTAAAT